MKLVTLRNLPPDLAKIIRKKADETGASVNKAVIRLLEEGLGTKKKKGNTLHHDLDMLTGSWSKQEAASFERALERQRTIDKDLWQ
jgi:TRAP-type C4-dicarboxylate transport system substrate-binding protein